MADRTVSYAFTGDFRGLTAGLAAAGKAVGDLGTKLTALDKNGAQMRAGLTTLGGAAGKFGLAAAAGIGVAVAASANFDAAMSKVQAATGESADAMQDLREAALQAGADTAFSASEAAAGIEALAKAGVSTQDILSGGLMGALDLAAAGELDVAQAAEIAATTMTQFGLAGSDVSGIADVLSAAAGKAQGSVQDMAGALQYVGPVAAQMGLSLEETGGSIAYLATQGIVGQQAGTSLRGMLTALTSPSKAAKEQMEALGISMYDASGHFIGLDGLAGQLKSSMSGLTEAERDEALGRIFGNEQITAARILYAGGAEAITDWTNKVDDSGYAAQQAATKLDNLKGDLEAFKGSLETALIGAGDGSQEGPLRSLVQNATSAVNAFNDLSPAMKSTATGMLGITAILGGGLWFTSKVVNGIASTKGALQQLGLSADSASGSLRGVGKASASLLAAYAALSAVDAAFNSLDDRVSDADLQRNLEAFANGAAVEDLDSLGESVRSLNSGIDRTFDLVGNTLTLTADTSTWEKAQEDVEKVDQALAGLVESGKADEAALVFDRIQQQAADLGVSAEDVADSFDSYGTALRNASGESSSWIDKALEASGTEDHLGQAIDQATGHIETQTASLTDNVAAMVRKREAALAAFDAETQWRSALVAARKAAAENSAGIKGNTEAALDNREKLSALAAAWNNQSKAVQNTEGRFKAARTAFIDTAMGMGVSEDAAKALARELMELPKNKVIPVDVKTDTAMRGIANLEARLNAISDEDVWINIRHRSDGRDTGMGPQVGAAAGGPVHGLGFAPDNTPNYLQESAA